MDIFAKKNSAYRGGICTCSAIFHCKILMRSKVINFLRKKSKFQINRAWNGSNSNKIGKFLVLDNFSWGNIFSQDLNRLDFHTWGAMLEKYQAYVPKPANVTELKILLEACWHDLPQKLIENAVLAFRKRLKACIELMVDTLSTYFHSNQLSRPSHTHRPF